MTSACTGLQQDRLVRQLIGAGAGGAGAWKMPRQEASYVLHAGDRGATEVAASEVPLHLAADLVPLGLRNARCQAPIGQNLHIAVGKQYVDENAIVLGGVPDAQLAEQLQRPLPRREVVPKKSRMQGRFNDKTDLTRMLRFDLRDARLNGRKHGRR